MEREACLEHSGIVQSIQDLIRENGKVDKQIRGQGKEIEGLKKILYMSSGAIMVITPLVTIILQKMFHV